MILFFENAGKCAGLFIIGVYRSIGTTWLGGACRFHPSCSEYSMLAFQKHSFLKATKLSIHRVCRCRPGGGCGYDPVP